jgi:HAD superfamily hydrolase (TIGR01484 family)
MTMLPVAAMPLSTLKSLRVVLTDIDDTLTLHGRLPPLAYQALADLQKAGLRVIPITGRSAGWCDHIARMWPVDGVVGENGAFYFRYDDATKKLTRVFAQSAAERAANKSRLWQLAKEILQDFPGTAIASDQAYREIDVAIDFCEDVPALPLAVAQKIAARFEAAGATAKVSSIHVNAWIGHHDKLTMSLRMLRELYDIDGIKYSGEIAYCGDSPNDAPMFAGFPNGIGVANIKPYISLMSNLPRYLTNGEGGFGFAEFAALVQAAKR